MVPRMFKCWWLKWEKITKIMIFICKLCYHLIIKLSSEIRCSNLFLKNPYYFTWKWFYKYELIRASYDVKKKHLKGNFRRGFCKKWNYFRCKCWRLICEKSHENHYFYFGNMYAYFVINHSSEVKSGNLFLKCSFLLYTDIIFQLWIYKSVL